jgi:hypothetical protein
VDCPVRSDGVRSRSHPRIRRSVAAGTLAQLVRRLADVAHRSRSGRRARASPGRGSLPSLPRTAQALARGELSYSKIRALTRVATPETEERLLAIGREGTAKHVERTVRGWRRLDRIAEAKEATPASSPSPARVSRRRRHGGDPGSARARMGRGGEAGVGGCASVGPTAKSCPKHLRRFPRRPIQSMRFERAMMCTASSFKRGRRCPGGPASPWTSAMPSACCIRWPLPPASRSACRRQGSSPNDSIPCSVIVAFSVRVS